MKADSKTIFFCCVLAFVGCMAVGCSTGFSKGEARYFFPDGHSPDAFEYYLPAANLALYRCFPCYGFIGSLNEYQLHPQPESISYFRDTKSAGVIVFPSKPPFYSFVLGSAFKIFGLFPAVVTYLNKSFLALTALLLLCSGFWMRSSGGHFAAFAALAAFLFLAFAEYTCVNLDAETLTMCLAMAAFCTVTLAFKKSKNSWRFIAGVVTGLLLLTKGYFVITWIFLSLYWLYVFLKRRMLSDLSGLLLFNAGIGFILLPWILYINPLLQKDIPQRLAFHERLKKTAPQIYLSSHEQMFDSAGIIREDVIDWYNKFHQYQHATENGFVFISNQYGEYNILNVHNEFCVDGDFHPEWKIISSSFYNQLPEQSKHGKLLAFYTRNPLLGLRITAAKLLNIWSYSGMLFYAALCFTLIALFKSRIPPEMLTGFILLANIFIVLILFYGDVRFVQTTEPVSLLIVSGTLLTVSRKLLFR